ncbi:MAG TPA: glucosamine-6-phosphate deaminase [Nitrospiraceae bacterium]|nr:glucosamine-6-phosphate deaminase [Nitrospiraceae bacterium]
MVLITDSAEEGSRTAARLVGQAIANNPALRLGLAAGNTPTGLYRHLVSLHRSARLDFTQVRLFSLDEFAGLSTESPHSFHAFYRTHLLDHINVEPAQLHLINGETDKDIGSYCESYERLIRKQGGIDLQILGIGRNGHLGFNEPGSSLRSRTRLTLLSAGTRRANARQFRKATPPEWAVTMGIGTILEARALLLLAFGQEKAVAVAKAVEGPVTASVPASALQLHPIPIVILDRKAASRLKNKAYYRQEATRWDMLLPDWLR